MNFQQDVIERSETIPVLVDFWAPWCGPCRVLSPVLDQLAQEQKGQWELVKINTEEHQDLALQYRIRSIPNVKLFFRGMVAAEFMGALPKPQIEKWLEQNLPKKEALALEDILSNAGNWPERGIRLELEDYLERHPENKAAQVAFAEEIVLEDPEKALELISEQQYTDPYDDLRAISDLLQMEAADNGQVAEHLMTASKSLKKKDIQLAIKSIISAAAGDKDYHNELPRRAGIAIFHLLGDEHALSRKYRRHFNMMLSV